jgi:hypothetical protein
LSKECENIEIEMFENCPTEDYRLRLTNQSILLIGQPSYLIELTMLILFCECHQLHRLFARINESVSAGMKVFIVFIASVSIENA